MENEIMEYEEAMDDIDVIETEPESSGVSAGVAMLIGAGVTAVSIAAVKLGKKLIAKVKARKEARESDEHDFVDVSDEDDE